MKFTRILIILILQHILVLLRVYYDHDTLLSSLMVISAKSSQIYHSHSAKQDIAEQDKVEFPRRHAKQQTFAGERLSTAASTTSSWSLADIDPCHCYWNFVCLLIPFTLGHLLIELHLVYILVFFLSCSLDLLSV